VLIVVRNVKFPSNLTQTGLFTAENAGQREEAREEDIRLSLILSFKNIYIILSVNAVKSIFFQNKT